jgi:hypothetical protein
MKPGTKPKPTHLKLIEGNRGKRPLNRKEAKGIVRLTSHGRIDPALAHFTPWQRTQHSTPPWRIVSQPVV